ncbi:DUF7289 family protein [Haloarchaeobius sp. DFWS5]|uniref:DUF7289 family protein n=1 Tax=Haloarchaeobius sp. DFWS5 TaxID=3446114 RepID=UPI003EBB8F29
MSTGAVFIGGGDTGGGRRPTRAQAEVLGVVLMIGIVAVGAVTIVFFGSMTIEETEHNAESQRIEQVFSKLDASVDSVALGSGSSEEVDFDIRSRQGAVHREDTGRIVVSANGTELQNHTFGSIVYENDGTVYAYQAGGLWRGEGENSQVIASPTFNYRDGTLNLPIPVVTGEEELSSGRVQLRKNATITKNSSYVEGELVTVTITSDYYAGWAEYLDEQTNDVAVSVDHPNETVTVKLGRPVATGNFSRGLYATGGDDGDVEVANGNAEIDGDVRATGDVTTGGAGSITGSADSNVGSSLPELDEAIKTKIDGAKDNASIPTVDPLTQTLDDGKTYLVEGDILAESGDSIDVDLSGGDVTLLIAGNTTLDGGSLDVSGATGGETVRVYTTGNFAMKNARVGSGNATHLQMYGTSTMEVAITGGSGSQFYGSIYAPRDEDAPGLNDAAVAVNKENKCDEYDICIAAGNSYVKGAIIGGSTYVGQSNTLEYDDSLETVEPTLQLEDGLFPPPITFLHVSVHEVAVNDDEDERVVFVS